MIPGSAGECCSGESSASQGVIKAKNYELNVLCGWKNRLFRWAEVEGHVNKAVEKNYKSIIANKTVAY